MSNKPDRIPALDPAQPGIYRRILDAAKEVREQRQKEARAMTEFQRLMRRMQIEEAEDRAVEVVKQRRTCSN